MENNLTLLNELPAMAEPAQISELEASLILELPSGLRRITEAGKEALIQVCTQEITFVPVGHGQSPTARITPQGIQILSELAKLRMKSWQSTARWNPESDLIGIAGELASLLYFGFTPAQVLENFLGGLSGDRGVDFEWQGEPVDVKTTSSSRLRFRFNTNNRHSSRATAVLFSRYHRAVAEHEPVYIELLGWAWRFQLYPWMRSDERSKFVNYETLHREGVSRHVETLKDIKEEDFYA